MSAKKEGSSDETRPSINVNPADEMRNCDFKFE
jgi:hypothetical protein